MATRYFRLLEDLHVPERWYLDTPLDLNGQDAGSRLFMQGVPVVVAEPLEVSLFRGGRPLDFSLADSGAVPVVHPKVASVFSTLAPMDVQLFRVEVEGQTERYSLVNVTRQVRCIDDSASERVLYWKPEDGRPDKTGKYRNVVGMRIDKERVGDAKVFRPWGWTIALVVSEDIKVALEQTGATGLKFMEV
ncbi:imm11 family protein [Pyxidicoccus sp. 3LG]